MNKEYENENILSIFLFWSKVDDWIYTSNVSILGIVK